MPVQKKYKGGTTHRLALLHAIGQLHIVNGGSVKVSDIMPFMNVSKPTAIKVIKRLAERDELIMFKNKRVGNFGQWEFSLQEDIWDEYEEGYYKPYFQAYVNEVILS